MNRSLKIITWNCQGAFRKKAGFILEHKPDILVVPECEHLDKLVFASDIAAPTSILWFRSSTTKGLGILSYNGFTLKLRRSHNQQLKLIIPIAVTGPHIHFTLYAVWANNPADPDGTYVEQVWKALHHYNRYIKNSKTILAGDFNSNTIWDRKYRIGNHSAVVKRLEKKGIHSTYHHYHKQVQGKELHPTQFTYRHRDKPYHLDYCFVSKDLLDKVSSVEVGDYDTWIKHSDHVPVIVSFSNID